MEKVNQYKGQIINVVKVTLIVAVVVTSAIGVYTVSQADIRNLAIDTLQGQNTNVSALPKE